MNLNLPQWKRVLSEQEIKDLRAACINDTCIVDAIEKYLDYMMKGREAIPLDDPNWTVKRAYRDGELNTQRELKNAITEKD